VPFNVRIGDVDVPVGLGVIFLIVLLSALANFVTKPVATISGLGFTAIFLAVFVTTELVYERKRRGAKHEHIEQFNQQISQDVTITGLKLNKPHHKLVAIRSTQNLFMLEQALAETDPDTTDMVVMTAKVTPLDGSQDAGQLDAYDQHLMTAVVERAEKAGKKVTPLIVPTNNPLHAVLQTARDLRAEELVVGASNKFTAEEQLDQMAFYWINLHGGEPAPLTIRILSRTWDVHYDVGGGSRIPRVSERQARTVAELRAAGVGVRRVLMIHDNTSRSSDLFDLVLTSLDPLVTLDLAHLPRAANSGGSATSHSSTGTSSLLADVERAEKIGRELVVRTLEADPGTEIVRLTLEHDYDLLVIDAAGPDSETGRPDWHYYILEHAPCAVCLLSLPAIQREVTDKTPPR
jgi:nucleotide-binding universal stress UspA family protein